MDDACRARWLLPRFKAVISMLTTRIVQPGTVARQRTYCILGPADLLCGVQDCIFMGRGQHHHTVCVASHQIAWRDPDRAYRHRNPAGLDWDTVLAGAHPMPAREHRIAEFAAERHIAADAVDAGPRNPAAMTNPSEDGTPARRTV